ncbi:ABC transporter ATP-binding protein [Catellatospora sp. KI3]|uniref:ABC transporter ATP-binding protein n=1 Tax=Catellatospora sp. KI3 TaxID=3041620 RepID=UPI0024825CE8|nr:ABC transporter ATP-binding protein [Catellatospora sp. KI3]MDI1466171.1 ABC transporter ATP-binding protein [Catellatospora sp. KI3]
MTDAVRLTSVAKNYGAVRAVDGVDLSIARGQTVALLGPNGAGKSTTISMILGLLTPSAGTVEVFGTSPADAVRAGRVGAMLQESGFPASATVRELVQLARALYRDPLPLDEIMATADVASIADRRSDKLSGGQSQRLRFAFALAGNPELLILDEPTAALDVESRQQFWAAMRRYAATGRTVLFATHYLEEADDFADRVIVIARGRVVADGSGAEIKKLAGGRTVSFDRAGQDADAFTALPGVVSAQARGERVLLRCDDSDVTVRALFEGGHRVANLEVTGAGLEEAFLTLTAKTELEPAR